MKIRAMEQIRYNGIEYPTRTFNVLHDGEEREVVISVQSLSDAMGTAKEIDGTPEEEIDSTIYFYVLDNEITLSAEKICAECLDEPMEFISEE